MSFDFLRDRKVLVTGGSGFIGTSLVSSLVEAGASVCNVDLAPPFVENQRSYWAELDILDRAKLLDVAAAHSPDIVLHLAARTDCVETTTVEEGYRVNSVGTANVLDAICHAGTVKRTIITSSQFVCGPTYPPKHEEDYCPHTVYGASKVETERLTRERDPAGIWTIVRPVNIWGPHHDRYREEAWRVISKGLYLHPGGQPVVRTYGYVKNIVWQMIKILEAPAEQVHRRAIYLGDLPVDIYDWANAFSKQLRGTKARKVPRAVLRAIAMFGDVVSSVGLQFPLTSSRYRSMTSHYRTPTEETHRLFGEPPYSLDEGVAETVEWLRTGALDRS